MEAIILHNQDNTATVLDTVQVGDIVDIVDNNGVSKDTVKALSDIPRGHKLAVRDIKQNEKIIKYGFCIGKASSQIVRGEYIHIHNLESMRGRGDL